jgi:hypothetical protein
MDFEEEAVADLTLGHLADSIPADIVAHFAVVGEVWHLQIFQGSGSSAEKLGYSSFES